MDIPGKSVTAGRCSAATRGSWGMRPGASSDVHPDSQYVYWGPCPSFFDNPFTTTRGVHWTADAFLVISPDAVMTRVVQPVCGFHWGYSTEGEQTAALPLAPLDPAAWPAACAILREQYPHWEFRDEWAAESQPGLERAARW